MLQVQEALENYRTLLHLLWPMDQTGDIMGRLLLRYWYVSAAQDPKLKVKVICAFFNSVQRLNVKRAANQGVTMNFEEQEKVLKETLSAHGLRCEVPYEGLNKNLDRPPSNNYSGGYNPQRQQKPYSQQLNRGKNALVNGLRTCYDYNNGKCVRKLNTTGCENPKGEKFAHNCNVFLKDKNAACHGKHPRSDHK